ncbi:hypothetical protein [Piscirickettsia salmonis]|nr:hypothetical protein [Piscirickettsia salmonis]QHS25005.1 hypothetical protein GW538_02475 [Piscirickettsia salmonis]QHS28209.1 hypothetical protein GW537_02470 [Piscirickettsia salmonis]
MLGDFASLDVQNTYRGSDAYEKITFLKLTITFRNSAKTSLAHLLQ